GTWQVDSESIIRVAKQRIRRFSKARGREVILRDVTAPRPLRGPSSRKKCVLHEEAGTMYGSMYRSTSTQRRITMANVQNRWHHLGGIFRVIAAISMRVRRASAQDNGKRQEGEGKYAQLTALWWEWILEQPATGNPIFDETGEDAANGQPLEDVVFFLAGTLGGAVTREFTVP